MFTNNFKLLVDNRVDGVELPCSRYVCHNASIEHKRPCSCYFLPEQSSCWRWHVAAQI